MVEVSHFEVGPPEMSPLSLMEVDYGFLKVVCAVVEKGEHGSADELGAALGQRPGVNGLQE